MRTVAAYIAGFVTALALAAGAASITLTTTAGDDIRLGPAFGAKLALGRNATVPEVKADIVNYMRFVVQNYEYEQSRKALAASPFDPT